MLGGFCPPGFARLLMGSRERTAAVAALASRLW
jgi:hypothetical protein